LIGEGGAKHQVRGTERIYLHLVPLTRRFAAPSPVGRGICPEHLSTFRLP
jgi:hypothetical protein